MPGFTITLNSLGVAAAKRADMLRFDAATGYTFTDSIDQTILYKYINDELAALWDLLVSTYEDYCIRRKTISVKADQEEYPMPPDFLKFRKAFPIVNGKRGRVLKKFHLADLGQADSYAPLLTSPIERTRYRLTGNRLFLHPVPTNDAQVELWYIPRFDPITNQQDAIDFRFPAGWEDYVVEAVAAKLLEEEESDASAQKARAKELLARIMTLAEDRDAGEPFQMIDAEGYLDTTL